MRLGHSPWSQNQLVTSKYCTCRVDARSWVALAFTMRSGFTGYRYEAWVTALSKHAPGGSIQGVSERSIRRGVRGRRAVMIVRSPESQ
jgi:hypothetical protein